MIPLPAKQISLDSSFNAEILQISKFAQLRWGEEKLYMLLGPR
jgi:hypothetical protein